MKKFILILFIFWGNTTFAQPLPKTPPAKVEKQIAFDVSNFVLRYFSFDEGNNISSAYIFLYRKGYNGKNWRYGLGFDFDYDRIPNDERTDFDISLNLKLGREYYKDFGKRWRAYYGWEIGLGSSYSEISIDKDKEFVRRATLSGILLTGIQFRINQKLSLFTEARYALNVFSSYRSNNDNKFQSISSNFRPPFSLFFNYVF